MPLRTARCRRGGSRWNCTLTGLACAVSVFPTWRRASAPDFLRRVGPWGRRVADETLVIAVMSGVLLLARHARDRAAAGGNALMRAQIYPISEAQPTGLGHTRFYGFPDELGDRVLTAQPPAAETVAELDDLAQGGSVLAAASGMLVNEIGQAFGLPEMVLISRDGKLRRPAWGPSHYMITWAEGQGIEVTDDTTA